MHRRRLLRIPLAVALGVLALALLASASAAPRPAALGYTVDWEPTQVVSNPALRGVYPSVAIDANQHMHVVYLVENPGSVWDLLYTNNIDGSFKAPSIAQANIGNDRTPFFKLAIDAHNTLHLAYAWYGKDKLVYYRQGSLSGAAVSWSAPQLISDGNVKAIDPYLAVDAAGNAHFVWADQRCGWPIYNVYYRMRRPDGSLTSSTPLKPDCSVMQRSSRITLTSDGTIHTVFMVGDELYYARLESGRWLNRDISESHGINTYNPTLTSDGTGLYVAWDDAVNGHDIRFRRSADGGQNWSSIVVFSGTSDFASYPYATYSATRKRVYVAWGDSNGQPYMQSRIWYREFDPASGTTSQARLISDQSGPAMWPALSARQGRVALSWQDRSTNVWRALTRSGSLCGKGTQLAADTSRPSANPQAEYTIHLPIVDNERSQGC